MARLSKLDSAALYKLLDEKIDKSKKTWKTTESSFSSWLKRQAWFKI
jgi:hypothetical protein